MQTGNQSKADIRGHLLSGIIMGVLSVIVWFLLTPSTRTIGAMIFGALLVMTALNCCCLALVKRSGVGVRRIVRSALIGLNAAVFLCAAVYTLAPTLLFYPNSSEDAYQQLQARTEAQELTIAVGGQTLSGWMLRNADGRAPLVLYFGGNGENASRRMLRILDNDLQTIFKGYNVAMLDYPGYGKSSGAPSEESLRRMGLAAYDALAQRDDVDAEHIVAFGYSLGTGVANYVASRREVAGLMLMAPYPDGYSLYNGMFDIFHGPLRLLVAYRMESIAFAKDIAVSPLIFASKGDEAVGYEGSVRLSKAYPAGCEFVSLEGLGHNQLWGAPAVRDGIADYLAEALPNG